MSLQNRKERKTAFAYIYQFIEEFDLMNKEIEQLFLSASHEAFKTANSRWKFGKKKKLEAIRDQFEQDLKVYQ